MAAEAKEFVLPSGAFARLRPLTYRDYLESKMQDNSPDDIQVALILRSLTIDGDALTRDQLMDMDLRDAMIVSREFGKLISGPIT